MHMSLTCGSLQVSPLSFQGFRIDSIFLNQCCCCEGCSKVWSPCVHWWPSVGFKRGKRFWTSWFQGFSADSANDPHDQWATIHLTLHQKVNCHQKQKAEDHSIFPRFPHWSLVLWLHGSRKKVTMTSPLPGSGFPEKKTTRSGVSWSGLKWSTKKTHHTIGIVRIKPFKSWLWKYVKSNFSVGFSHL